MNTQSIFRPLIFVALFVSIAALGILAITLYATEITPIEDAALNEAIIQEQTNIQARIQSKLDAAMAMALMLSGRPDIIRSLDEGDRDVAAEGLKNIQQELADISQYKNVGVQVIDADKVSFVKSWNLDSFGEKAANPLVDKAFDSKHIQGSLGVGAKGIALVGFAPVIHKNNVIGLVTAAQGVASVVKDIQSMNKDWLLLLDDHYLNQRYKGIPPSVKENLVLGEHFRIAHSTWFNPTLVEWTKQHTNLLDSDQPSAYLIDQKLVVILPVLDELNALMGRHIIVQDASHLLQTVSNKKMFVWMLLLGIMLLIVALVLILLWQMKVLVMRPLEKVVYQVKEVIASGNFNARIDSRNNDEIGILTQSINDLFKQLECSIKEANNVMQAIASADFSKRMTSHYQGDLHHLKANINASSEQVAFMMTELGAVMQSLESGQFNTRMDQKVPQSFRQQVDRALSSMHEIIEDINDVMANMSQGDFTGRINADAKGDFSTMKENVNCAISAMASAIHAISDVVMSQAQGDLTKTLPSGTFKGQLHELKNAINYSTERVRQSVAQSIHASSVVNEASATVSQGAMDLTSRIQEQASALEQTSATMDNIHNAVGKNTQNANQVAKLAHQVETKAREGVSVMQTTIEAMKAIEASSSKMTDIVSLIDSIAFQTNLLALNAAVEAARAGDHGRGFAVVASEVRTLAQKSADAAKDIKTLIEDNNQKIAQGTQLADQSGESLKEISHAIESVAERAEAIASASNEQSTGIGEVHKAIADIDRVTQENAALIENTSSAADQLKAQANALKEEMAFLKSKHRSTICKLRAR